MHLNQSEKKNSSDQMASVFCFAKFAFLVSCDGWAALPRGATGLYAVCDCGISWSYSLTISKKDLFFDFSKAGFSKKD